MLFNKPVDDQRFGEVREKLLSFGWFPYYTNAEELRQKYGHGDWSRTPAHKIEGRSDAQAYADMPQEMVDYIRSLPEYDEEIFAAIAGLDDRTVERAWH